MLWQFSTTFVREKRNTSLIISSREGTDTNTRSARVLVSRKLGSMARLVGGLMLCRNSR
jgi:hypothetical protein